MSDSGIRVTGPDEFSAFLDKATADLPAEITKADQEMAEAWAEETRSRAEALGGVAAHSVSGITSEANTGGLDPSMETVMGANYGALQWHQFPAYNPEGYFTGPATTEVEKKVDDRYGAIAGRLYEGN